MYVYVSFNKYRPLEFEIISDHHSETKKRKKVQPWPTLFSANSLNQSFDYFCPQPTVFANTSPISLKWDLPLTSHPSND